MDSRIAAIVLANHGMLISANLNHFQQVPGLHVEDWLRD
jgi:predicted nucleic acid-binding protein